MDFFGDGGGAELSLYVLDHYLMTLDAAKLQRYLPIVTLSIEFARRFYSNRTAEGKVEIWPTQGLETFWCDWPSGPAPSSNCCIDDMPTVSGITSVLQKLLALPTRFTTPAQRDEWTTFLSQMPALPMSADGTKLLPARVTSSGTHNSEPVELYAVHPHRIMTVGRALVANVSLTAAINSYHTNPLARDNTGWTYGILDAALLGQAEDALRMTLQRSASAPAPGYRFAGFAPHYQVRVDNHNKTITIRPPLFVLQFL